MRLSAGLSQKQSFSPQMQQGLQLLQAPMMELRQLLEAELVLNPLLEEEFLPQKELDLPFKEKESLLNNFSEPWREEMNTSTRNEEADEQRRYFLESQALKPTLRDVLLEQTAAFPKEDEPIIELIIGNLDECGYFRTTCNEVAAVANVSERQVDQVLKKVQQLDPPGIAARDLKECLLLQLIRQKKQNSLASRIIAHYLPQLAKHNYDEIAKTLRVKTSDILQASKVIAQLEPHPARPYSIINEQAVIADVIVFLDNDKFIVRLNEEELPRIRINDHYKETLAEQPHNSELRNYLREKIRSGKVFIQSLDQRKETLLAVCREIVQSQYDFLKHGPYGLHPLTMSAVATAINVHETTVGRAIAGKYIDTPRGIFPLKYFFTTGFEREEGTAVSNEMVKTALRQLIDQENKKEPLSDQELVTRLQEKGIKVARRTISHYREQLGILPKSLRRLR